MLTRGGLERLLRQLGNHIRFVAPQFRAPGASKKRTAWVEAPEFKGEVNRWDSDLSQRSIVEAKLGQLRLTMPNSHDVLVAFYFYDVPLHRIADSLQISKKQVVSRLRGGRRQLLGLINR